MANKTNRTNNQFLLICGVAALLLSAVSAFAQSPTPTPAPVTLGGFEVTSSIEFGARASSVNGNENKFRSDYNFRNGFRLFDSSFRLENKEKKDKFIDSIQVNSTGWDADPSGFTRVNVEKAGLYNFTANVRQISYFNNLNNSGRGGHNADTRQRFGDFDLTLYPMQDKLRVRLGASFASVTGTSTITTRAYSDEFIIPSNVKNRANDLRAGVDTELAGFNLSLTYGLRRFRDRTVYSITGPNPGFNTTNTSALATWVRAIPINGATNFGMFTAQRTFAKKLDFTARLIYSDTTRNYNYTEQITGRDNSNNIVDLDNFFITGLTKRPQTRADLGLTYLVTDKFRISETFTFDQFHISGGEAFAEQLYSRTSAGVARATVFTNSFWDRTTGWRKFANTIEGDYQFSDKFSVNLGYRWAKRRIVLQGFNQTLPPATTPTRTLIDETEENTTKTIIAGMKIKPMKGWVIFGDAQRGDADNAFVRLANYKFTNLRLRSRWSYKMFAFNVSGISKDNENPSTSTAPAGSYPSGNFNANTKQRLFSTFVDVSPDPRFSASGGYTYNRQISETDVVINTGTSLQRGISRYYMKDHYAFFNLSVQPVKRVSFFAGYNYDKDNGQGSLTGILPILISSYPFKLTLAESRLAFRLTKNVEWNLGYQYIGYNETVQPLSTTGYGQDYHANLPYTSLRIYFGGGDR